MFSNHLTCFLSKLNILNIIHETVNICILCKLNHICCKFSDYFSVINDTNCFNLQIGIISIV